MSEVLTLDEVAARLRVSRRTVNRLVHDRLIRVFYVGPQQPRVTAQELEAYVASRVRAA